jgi:transketolase
MPGSGTGQELLAWAGIDAEHIAEAARRLVEAGTLIGTDGFALPGQLS